ncbi:MAG: aminotransferase class V-fold PLP-dependent enzyme [Candidatus Abyssobacteria bacterium SURF_17]|uniref:Aminotransferase class V-fold PLP-dependent enzyme n=1 Tax=Candidatus Abyssobacteria bacterium SURF_17 TaxID=2093361 RepID=A0A419EPL1_9BACT|nr:MAG: aminotransferase class V-fold PLP-dependent enzyme [Candidatus Abyssubacteria bacterium SURF_17]
MGADFEEIRKLFPVTEKFTYFLANGKSPLPKPVADAAHEMIDTMMNSGIVATRLAGPMVNETREKVARLIGCDAGEVAFSRNTAEGILWLAQSIPWQEGDEVLMTQHEYPTLVYPFMAQQHYGVRTILVEQDDRRITPEVIRAGITDRTRLVAVSWPQFDTGQRCDLKSISTICHERNILLLVDPIQCLGSIRLNVRDMNIDCLCAGTYKGLLGLTGLGIFYCRRSLLETLRPVHVGWASLEKQLDEEYSTNSYEFEPAREARRYEEGAKNHVGIAALNAALDFIEEIGVENIEARVKELTDYLCEKAEAKGCKIVSPRQGDEWSGIVLMRLPKQDPYKLAEELREKLILVHAMRNCLITGVNFYNNFEDIDRLLFYIKAD